jgi:hypothetical protein
MNAELKTMATEQLVTLACQRRKALDDAKAELLEVEARLIAKAPGQYAGVNGELVTVVGPLAEKPGKISYELGADAMAIERAREIAGEKFPELFEREVSYVPKEGFEARADVALTPARKEKILMLCRKIGKPTSAKSGYVLYK